MSLIALVAIVVLLLWVSSYSNYKSYMQITSTNFNLILMILPLVLFLIVQYERLFFPTSSEKHVHGAEGSSLTWAWGAMSGLALYGNANVVDGGSEVILSSGSGSSEGSENIISKIPTSLLRV
ncbi:unnamed protein product [Lupinus luteus]|uniref:Uncharacterized protein n=1 Tax=Lupinus luteus TaxID=3873 RepID=A0AAV1XRZ0_LUPLU